MDAGLFHFINQTLSNRAFDSVLPFFSWNPLFVPALILLSIALLWKGGRRGWIFLTLLALVIAIGDGVICHSLKDWVHRPRPFLTLTDAHVLVGRGKSGSFPSSHAANWAAATTLVFFYYRRSLWIVLPMALIVSFSRIYLGVHYPSDVLAGLLLGVLYSAGIVWGVDRLWRWAGPRWFSRSFSMLPSLRLDGKSPISAGNMPELATEASIDAQWVRAGYAFVAITLLLQLIYLASGTIELSEDEAYQWLWSKHLDISYYSKPPLIAYTQFLGTSLWGDNAFGVRFFSPVIAAIIGVLSLRFFAREVNAWSGFWLLVVLQSIPLLGVGTTLMTIDPLSVLFWTLAMYSGWRAVRNDSTQAWIWCGLWMGLGFLSKYTALFQLLCWAFFFMFWRPARAQLRRPGPYLALIVLALCTLPVLIWNARHHWITVTHLANRGGLDHAWRPTLRFLFDFVWSELALLNPVFFVATIWAIVALVKRHRDHPLLLYFLSMGAPLFLFYFFYTLRARVQPNWIAPSVVPFSCLMVVYWATCYRGHWQAIRRWFVTGVVLGLIVIVVGHDTDLIRKVSGRYLPASKDPLRRVRGWSSMAAMVGEARNDLLKEGKPVFIIGDHYGITGLISFYLPEAKSGVPGHPLAYYESSDSPKNQFYFWPGYDSRKGENAIFVRGTDDARPAPERLLKEFDSVKDLGLRDVLYRGRVLHQVQIFECRGLR